MTSCAPVGITDGQITLRSSDVELPTAETTDPAPPTMRRPWPLIVLVIGSVVAHAWMIAAHSHGTIATLLMIAMTAWCLWCAVELVTRLTRHCLRRLLAMSVAMIVVHAWMLMGTHIPLGSGHGHHDHGGAATAAITTSTPEHAGTSPAGAMLGIILLEYAIAVGCGFLMHRRSRTASRRGRPTFPQLTPRTTGSSTREWRRRRS